MKAILHIGLQKTGTSSIQVMLAKSEAYLNSIGYSYPSLPEPEAPKSFVWKSPFRHNCVAGTYADFSSVFEKMNPSEADFFWKNISEGGFVPILSAEEFSRQKDFSPIAQAMSAFEIDVVVYLRRQDKYIESLYNQRNKILTQREDTSCLTDEFLTEADLFHFIKVSGYKRMLNYVDMLRRVQDQLKPANIIVRNFNRDNMIEGDVCADFCDAVQLDTGLMSHPDKEANQSISNATLTEWKKTFAENGSDAAKEFIRGLNHKIKVGSDFSGGYLLLSDTTRASVLAEYDAINREIEESFGVSIV